MDDLQQRFLGAYKRYEGILREQGLDYYSVAESAGDITRNRMHLLRQLRNFLSHSDDAGFVSVTEEHVRYLDDLSWEAVKHGNIMGKAMVPEQKCSCRKSEPLRAGMEKLIKSGLPYLCVCGDNGKFLGFVDMKAIVGLYLKDQEGTFAKANKRHFLDVPYGTSGPENLVSEVSRSVTSDIVLVTSDGGRNGELFGLWMRK